MTHTKKVEKLNVEFFIVRKLVSNKSGGFSAFIIKIAIAAVALSIATMIVATSLVNGFQNQIRQKVFSFWAHIHIKPYTLSDSHAQQGIARYQDFYLHKEKLKGVKHIQAFAIKGGILKTKDNLEGIVLKGVGEDFDWQTFRQSLKKGSPIAGDAAQREKQILISLTTANRLHLDTGDKVIVNFIDNEIRTRSFRVKGIYETGIEEYDKQFALIDLGVIQQLNNWGKDTVGGFEVFLSENKLFKSRLSSYYITIFGGLLSDEARTAAYFDPIDEIAMQMNHDIDNMQLEAVSIKELKPGLFDWLELQTMNELIVLTLMIIVAIINMITTMLIIILDRTNMIGILKAIGTADNRIKKIFLYYALTIAVAGLLIGNIVGLAICYIQQYFHLLKLPQESYYLTYAPIEINYAWVAAINIATIVVCLVVLLLPAHLVTKITAIKAIRFE